MRNSFFLLVILISLNGWGQFNTEVKNDKFGFSYNGILIKKAKFDSLKLGDSKIVTAYKRKHVYYFNEEGKKIYQTKLGLASTFSEGTGIVKNKKGQYGIVKDNGEFLMEPTNCDQPQKYGAYIYVSRGDYHKKQLYNSKALIEQQLDSIEKIHKWLITSTITKETHVHRKKGLLGRNKSTTTYTYTERMKVYDIETTTLVEEGVSDIQPDMENYIFHQENGSFSIRSINTDKELRGLSRFQHIDSNFFAANQNQSAHLFTRHNLENIISGDFDLFILRDSTIHALVDTLEPEPKMAIYSHQGELLNDNITFISDLGGGRFVFGKDSLAYIGSETGKQLSGLYTGIGAEKNGYRTIYGAYSYGYINDETYEKVPGDFPIIGRKRSTYNNGRRHRNFIKSFVTGVVNTVRLFTRRPPLDTYSTTYYDPNEINIIEDANGFYEGHSVISISYINSTNQYDSLTLTDNSAKLRYNYIDSTGKRLSSVEYNDCSPFMNGHAWVKQGDYMYLINTTGKRQNNFKFSSVDRDEHGYFKVSYRGRYGVVGPNYNLIIPCKYSYLKYREGQYIENDFGNDNLIYEIPKTSAHPNK